MSSGLTFGDEVTAVVVDLGSGLVKAGFAGEDCPKAVFDSALLKSSGDGDAAVYAADAASTTRAQADCDVVSAFEQGLVSDWDGAETLLRHALFKRLGVAEGEHPVLLSEPSFVTRQQRERMCELVFEKFNAPALFTAKAPVMAMFAAGRTSALVDDCGAGGTTVTPVHDGYALGRSVQRSAVGGRLLDEAMLQSLTAGGTTIRPHFAVKRGADGAAAVDVAVPKGTRESYLKWAARDVARDVRLASAKCFEQALSNEIGVHGAPTASYELPDGTTIDVGEATYRVPELLIAGGGGAAVPGTVQGVADLIAAAGGATATPRMAQMVYDAVTACDSDIRRELFSSIILTGGVSLTPGLPERLQREVTALLPTNFTNKVKIVLSAQNANQYHLLAERRFSTWIGGSILSSLGTFQQMWISAAEYKEHGIQIIERKCP